MVVSEEQGKSIVLKPLTQELKVNAVLTGEILSKEDMGYLISFEDNQQGFLPFPENFELEKSTIYLPVQIIQISSNKAILKVFSINSDAPPLKQYSPGNKIRGVIDKFTDTEAEIECAELPHFTIKLAYEHFRREEKDNGFYKGFEDDFIILAIDFEMSVMFVSCEFSYEERDNAIEQYLTNGKFLINEKVIQHQIRTYLQPQFSQDPIFNQTWLYVNDQELRECDKLSFPPEIGETIPVVEVLMYEYFENLYKCVAHNLESQDQIQQMADEQLQLRNSFPLKIGQVLPKMYEVIVREIRSRHVYCVTSIFYEGSKEFINVITKEDFFTQVFMKENLEVQFKLTIVNIKFLQNGKVDEIVVVPYTFEKQPLDAFTCEFADFGSGIVIHCLNKEPYSIVQILGEEAICFQKLELTKEYNFEVIFKQTGQQTILVESENEKTVKQLMDYYQESDNEIILERLNSQAEYALGTVFEASALEFISFSLGSLIVEHESSEFLVPIEVLNQEQLQALIDNKKVSNQMSDLFDCESYSLIKQFGNLSQSRNILIPSALFVKSIELQEAYPAVITRKADAYIIATLFNGEEVHIRLEDVRQKPYLMQLIYVIVLRPLEVGFYIGRIEEEYDIEEDQVFTPKEEDLPTLDFTATNQLNESFEHQVKADILQIIDELPFPELIVDLGDGKLGKLDFRGLFCGKFDQSDIEKYLLDSKQDYETLFKTIVQSYCSKDGAYYEFYVSSKQLYRSAQLQYIGIQPQPKQLEIYDLQIFERAAESNTGLLIHYEAGYAVFQLLRKQKQSLLVMFEPEIRYFEVSPQKLLKLFDFPSLIKLEEFVDQKLLYNGVAQQFCLRDADYYAADCDEPVVEDEISMKPYPSRPVILPAKFLAQNARVSVRCGLAYAGTEKPRFLSESDVTLTGTFCPASKSCCHRNLLLSATVIQVLDEHVKLSLGPCGVAKLQTADAAQLKRNQVIQVVCEGVYNGLVQVSQSFGRLISPEDVGTVARSFEAVCSLAGEPSEFQLIGPREVVVCVVDEKHSYGDCCRLNVTRDGQQLVGEVVREQKTSIFTPNDGCRLIRQLSDVFEEIKEVSTLENAALYQGQQRIDYCLLVAERAKLENQKIDFDAIRSILNDEYQEFCDEYIILNENYGELECRDINTKSADQINELLYKQLDIDMGVVEHRHWPLLVEAFLYKGQMLRAVEFINSNALQCSIDEMRQVLTLFVLYSAEKDATLQMFEQLRGVNYGRMQKKMKATIEDVYHEFCRQNL